MGIEKREYRKRFLKYLIIIVLLITLTISMIIYYRKLDYDLREPIEITKTYGNYYAVIFTEEKSEYETNLLQGIVDAASDKNIYVKEIGEELSFNLTREEKLDLAIASKVDAIIVQGDNSEELKIKIEEAGTAGIPVITITEDCFDSSRKSFVGNSRYEIGRTFARQVIDVATSQMKDICILDSNNMLEENDLFFSGYKETMSNEGNHLSAETTIVEIGANPFEAEAQIQEILCNKESIPDILLVLDEENTNSTIQTLVDYNLVGEVKVIGFASSSMILEAINKGVIHSSVYLDPYVIGQDCVEVLNKLEISGYVNGYTTVEVFVINQHNIKNYLEESKDE